MSGPMLQSCRTCRHGWQFQRAACPACGAQDIVAAESGGGGTVWSVTTVLRAPLPELDMPGGYGIALVTLDEGPRIMCRSAPGLAIGERVQVAVEADGMPRAVPAGSELEDAGSG
ncbi:OB-fold domain-containing protein [Phreatobacter sp.]|uniref:Zn-ribbon domain-containing OB-fold protein n=1 Tax=Phreatobacter sp. TaxID=1966341 RepID=UPI0025E2D636|nr:OB-fold domain-containing protein [Phreatobacter sp.]